MHRALNDAQTTPEMIRAMASQEEMAARRRQVEARWDALGVPRDDGTMLPPKRRPSTERKRRSRPSATKGFCRKLPCHIAGAPLSENGITPCRSRQIYIDHYPKRTTKRTKPTRSSAATRVRASTPSRGSTVEKPFLPMLVIAIFLVLANTVCG